MHPGTLHPSALAPKHPCTRACLVAALCLAAIPVCHATAQTPDAGLVLAAARDALGGEKRLSAVRSVVVTGRTRQVRGESLVPIEFEISFELPDKHVRRDEIPAQESGPTTIGFNGGALIQIPVPPAPVLPVRTGGPPAPGPAQLEATRNARVTVVKQDFARLALGMFAASFGGYPLTFTYVGESEAPQGKADVIDVTASGPPEPDPPFPSVARLRPRGRAAGVPRQALPTSWRASSSTGIRTRPSC